MHRKYPVIIVLVICSLAIFAATLSTYFVTEMVVQFRASRMPEEAQTISRVSVQCLGQTNGYSLYLIKDSETGANVLWFRGAMVVLPEH